MKKTILFLGDSFTWGEGLELYCDTPKWQSERFIENNWPQLAHKQDFDGINFRETNRFPAIVGKMLDCDVIVDKTNGGSLHSFIRLAESNLYNPYNNIDTIIIQISCLDREMYHLHEHCKCDICVNSEYCNIFTQISVILEKLYKNEILTTSDKFILNFFQEKTGYQITEPMFFVEFDKLKFNWYQENFSYFISKYVNKWRCNGLRTIYFIDSWEIYSSNTLFNVVEKNLIIPLIGMNDKPYYKWPKWLSTFEFKTMNCEFPNTKNQHPTLTQHKYIANSIIDFLKIN